MQRWPNAGWRCGCLREAALLDDTEAQDDVVTLPSVARVLATAKPPAPEGGGAEVIEDGDPEESDPEVGDDDAEEDLDDYAVSDFYADALGRRVLAEPVVIQEPDVRLDHLTLTGKGGWEPLVNTAARSSPEPLTRTQLQALSEEAFDEYNRQHRAWNANVRPITT